MTRYELEHAIRAACDVSSDTEVYVIGSQAILGQFPEAPAELRQSAEVDMVPKNRPDKVAAYRRAAVISSVSRSGNSWRICSRECPLARRSSTSITRILIPRMQGRPPHCAGLTVMRLSKFGIFCKREKTHLRKTSVQFSVLLQNIFSGFLKIGRF